MNFIAIGRDFWSVLIFFYFSLWYQKRTRQNPEGGNDEQIGSIPFQSEFSII